MRAASHGCFFSSKLHITYELLIYFPILGRLKCTLCRTLWAQVQNNNSLLSCVLWKHCRQAGFRWNWHSWTGGCRWSTGWPPEVEESLQPNTLVSRIRWAAKISFRITILGTFSLSPISDFNTVLHSLARWLEFYKVHDTFAWRPCASSQMATKWDRSESTQSSSLHWFDQDIKRERYWDSTTLFIWAHALKGWKAWVLASARSVFYMGFASYWLLIKNYFILRVMTCRGGSP